MVNQEFVKSSLNNPIESFSIFANSWTSYVPPPLLPNIFPHHVNKGIISMDYRSSKIYN